MAKVALLIGVSEYEPGLKSLPAAIKDVEAMQRVLQHPDMGDFAELDIKVLKNPGRQEMEDEIQTLFDDRHRDDLVLFFFSGHGIKDSAGKFYLSSRTTCKTARGELRRSTATSASFVQENQRNCRSRRQVIILDCCFSGAFAEGMLAKDDGSVDIRSQLGSEGGAVLTSSSSIEYSFELQGSDLSVYTRYLVEGLETGDADQDRDGFIAIGELHEYAKRKVQETAPGMKPEIHPSKEGYNIRLARVPSTDPTLCYRREIQRLAYSREITFSRLTFVHRMQEWLNIPLQNNIQMSSTRRKTLEVFRQKLGLSPEIILQIESETLQPYRELYQGIESYEQELIKWLKKEKPLKDSTRRILRELQHALKISDENAVDIEQRVSQRIRNAPYLNIRNLSGFPKLNSSSPVTYMLISLLAIGTTAGLVSLMETFQPRQQFNQINGNSMSPPDPRPSSSEPSPSVPPSYSDTFDVHYRNGIKQQDMGRKSHESGDLNNARNFYESAIQEFDRAIEINKADHQGRDVFLHDIYGRKGNINSALDLINRNRTSSTLRISQQEFALIQPGQSYPVWSPYDAFEAANTMLEEMQSSRGLDFC